MDKLAAALGLDPVELRLLNALKTGDSLITGQVLRGAAPVAEVIRTCAGAPLPPGEPADRRRSSHSRAAQAARQTASGCGAVSGSRSGSRTSCTRAASTTTSMARCRLEDGVATITLRRRRGRTGLRDTRPADHPGRSRRRRRRAGAGGHDRASGRPARHRPAARPGCPAAPSRRPAWRCAGGCSPPSRRGSASPSKASSSRTAGSSRSTGEVDLAIADAAAWRGARGDRRLFRHAPTTELDDDGQGDAHVSFAFAAHRAVVDVDLDLGLVRVVEITTSQDVGRVLNPGPAPRPGRRRHRPGRRARGDGGDRARQGTSPKPLLHRLHHPDGPRHAVRCTSRR